MASKSLIPLLVTMMLVTGVCNTLLTKYQDMQCVRNCDSPDPKERVVFEQPVLQTLQMFIGEMGCWIVLFIMNMWNRKGKSQTPLLAGGYESINSNDDDDDDDDETSPALGRTRGDQDDDAAKPFSSEGDDNRIRLRGWKVFLLAAPACCDITGTTLMNVGLLFVVASIYQMTRGALVLFVGLFSVVFLRRKLYLYQWFGLVCVVGGVGLVGLAGAVFKDASEDIDLSLPPDTDIVTGLVRRAKDGYSSTVESPEAVHVVAGVLLIAGAQVFTATQFVLEEWILEHYAMDPLKVVGWEGIFGALVTAVGMVILHLAIGITESGKYGYFDAAEGWRNITTNKTVAITGVLVMISIGGFNYFGLSVTRSVSATSRSTIDTSRTLFIWLVSLGLGWESFKWLQVVGFAMLVYGTFLFNDIIRPPLKACLPTPVKRRRNSILPEEPIEHS